MRLGETTRRERRGERTLLVAHTHLKRGSVAMSPEFRHFHIIKTAFKIIASSCAITWRPAVSSQTKYLKLKCTQLSSVTPPINASSKIQELLVHRNSIQSWPMHRQKLQCLAIRESSQNIIFTFKIFKQYNLIQACPITNTFNGSFQKKYFRKEQLTICCSSPGVSQYCL